MSTPGGRLGRFVRTARHLGGRQIVSRLRHLACRRRYARNPLAPFVSARAASAGARPVATPPVVPPDALLPGDDGSRIDARGAEYAAGTFTLLGRERSFPNGVDWHDLGHTPLWRYQMQYLQPVLDLVLAGRVEDARRLLASWRATHEGCWDAEAWHPYPASLRLVNLCHAAAAAGSFDKLGDGVADVVAAHAAYVLAHLETDVRGNHLLENARALLTASRFFDGPPAEEWGAVAREILAAEIPEQVLADGAHFELSPMYHCIVLQRLVELVHVVGAEDPLARDLLTPAIDRMSTYLSSILCPDDDIPLLGDSARGFGPQPVALLAAAGGLTGKVYERPGSGVTLHNATGVAVFRSPDVFALFDVGQVGPDYLPAHAQADALTIEVWVRGVCVVADPGVFDYVGPEREWGRSSRAHSTITLDDRDSSEVYASFRAGGRGVTAHTDRGETIEGSLAPWNDDARISRSVRVLPEGCAIEIADSVQAAPGRDVTARLHLHEDVRVESCDDGVAHLATPAGPVLVQASLGGLRCDASHRSPRFGERVETSVLMTRLQPREHGGYENIVTISAVAS